MERIIRIGNCAVDVVLVTVLGPLVLLSLLALTNDAWIEVGGEKRISEARDKVEHSSSEELFERYPKMVGWLKIEGTKIDYPVMQAKNNSWYLSRGFDDEYSGAGSLFIDYRNVAFEDDYMVIYGHRMSGENMFSEIAKFADDGYFNGHEKGELLTREGKMELLFYVYAEVKTDLNEIYMVGDYRVGRNEEVLTAIDGNRKNWRDVTLGDGDKIIVLSTCDRARKNYRDILVVKMVKV